jgi:hypothetical protein
MVNTIGVIDEMSFIPGNVPSLKNSKVKTSKGIFPSKTVSKYLKSFGISSYSSEKKTVSIKKTFKGNRFIDYFKEEELNRINQLRQENIPICIGFHFIRDSKRRFDFGNACQIICDLMTAYDIIEDDNMNCLIPFPIMVNDRWFSYDKENPGVLIKVINE